MAAYTYDPGAVLLNFNGVRVSGYASGTFIVAEREADAYTKSVGSDGEVARTRSRNYSGTVTVTLMQTSQSNDLLDTMALLDEQSNGGMGEVFISDVNGKTILSGSQAWIRKRPNTEYGDEAASREWVIDCANLQIVNGGAVG